MHFNGVARDSITHELGVSSGTVSGILSILPPTVAPLRELSVELKRNNMVLVDTLQSVILVNELKALGVTPNQFSASLQAVTKMCTEAGDKPETVMQAAI